MSEMKCPTDYKAAVQNAHHYQAIGVTDLELDNKTPGKPWEFVVEAVPVYGMWMVCGPSEMKFTSRHPCGLKFVWTMSLSTFLNNAEGFRKGFASMPEIPRENFKARMRSELSIVKDRASRKQKEASEELAEARLAETAFDLA